MVTPLLLGSQNRNLRQLVTSTVKNRQRRNCAYLLVPSCLHTFTIQDCLPWAFGPPFIMAWVFLHQVSRVPHRHAPDQRSKHPCNCLHFAFPVVFINVAQLKKFAVILLALLCPFRCISDATWNQNEFETLLSMFS